MTVGRSAGLDELFVPRSIAVIGASNRPQSVGESLFRNLLTARFGGVVYPVNPHWKSVSGVRCYPSVDALPETPELGVVIVPAAGVRSVVEDLGRRGTRGVVVISSGFAEVGGAGVELESRLAERARHYRMSLVGPNCFGVINTDARVSLNATFSDTLPPRGRIAFVSQSGALCAGILRYGIAERIGFSRFVSVGNRAGVDENDLLGSLRKDPATRVILLYVESLADGRRFLEAAREVTEEKPVLVIKSGRTPAGERAALSHTGSLARSGQDRLYDALFQQSGVLRADSIGELFRMAKMFGSGLKLEGARLAILTNSGGPGIVAADACARAGLELPMPSPESGLALRSLLSSSASVGNPVDMTADATPAQYVGALRILLRRPDVNGVLVIATPTGESSGAEVARAIVAGRGNSSKPLVACLFGLTDLSQEVQALESSDIPTFTFPEEAIAGLSSLARYHSWWTRPRREVRHFSVDRRRARKLMADARRLGRLVLPEFEARDLLNAYGIAFPAVRLVPNAEAAVKAAAAIGYPVALKVASPDISHKTEVGGVALNIPDAAGLVFAFAAMRKTLSIRAPAARVSGFEVEGMVRSGKEVLVGIQRDPAFGPVIVFGMGGIYVEVLRDVTFRLAPLRPLSAKLMVDSVRSAPLLRGVRGEPPSDLPRLYEAIERVSQLATENPEVAELDINPLIVRPAGEGVVAVDARVVLGPPSKSGPVPSGAQSAGDRRQKRPPGEGRRRR